MMGQVSCGRFSLYEPIPCWYYGDYRILSTGNLIFRRIVLGLVLYT